MIACITGHRPNKLFGYDLSTIEYTNMKNYFKTTFINKGYSKVISGMAQGVDTIAALAVLELIEEGYNIKLICAIPCRGQERYWSNKDQYFYNYILSSVDKNDINYISQNYNNSAMQKRNKWMVDNCDDIIAIWDGTTGGTYNCIKYAKKVGKQIYHIYPSVFKMEE